MASSKAAFMRHFFGPLQEVQLRCQPHNLNHSETAGLKHAQSAGHVEPHILLQVPHANCYSRELPLETSREATLSLHGNLQLVLHLNLGSASSPREKRKCRCSSQTQPKFQRCSAMFDNEGPEAPCFIDRATLVFKKTRPDS